MKLLLCIMWISLIKRKDYTWVLHSSSIYNEYMWKPGRQLLNRICFEKIFNWDIEWMREECSLFNILIHISLNVKPIGNSIIFLIIKWKKITEMKIVITKTLLNRNSLQLFLNLFVNVQLNEKHFLNLITQNNGS